MSICQRIKYPATHTRDDDRLSSPITNSLPSQVPREPRFKKDPSTFALVAEQPSITTLPSAAREAVTKQVDHRPAKKHYALGEAERCFRCPSCLRYRECRCDVRCYCAAMAITSQDPRPGSSASDEEASCGSLLDQRMEDAWEASRLAAGWSAEAWTGI